MGVISQNGIDYPVPSVPVQSDGSATDLTNAAVPTGQTIKSYLNSNFIKKVKINWSNVSVTTRSSGGVYWTGGSNTYEYIPPTGYSVIAIYVEDWSNLPHSFNCFYNNNQICLISDYSMTISSVVIVITLAKIA